MLKSIEISGFKSFGDKSKLDFKSPISAIVGPNGSGKSNIAEAFRFALGEQSMKSLRGKRSEDLIFNGSVGGARSNRASVKVIFDNSNRILDLDFDDVLVERVVHRDSSHEYKINESKVRRKDVSELLARANIGSTGHNIISQGEADRILNVTPSERRAMIEDALGLRVYHLKKKESELKLNKTEQNLKEAETLRREIRPHLNFLKKQIEKSEKAREIENKVIELYKEYFSYEEGYIANVKKEVEENKNAPKDELLLIDAEIAKLKQILDDGKKEDSFHKELLLLSEELSNIQDKRNKLTRELGRIEGEIDAIDRLEKKIQKQNENSISIPYSSIKAFFEESRQSIKEILNLDDISSVKNLIKKLSDTIENFFSLSNFESLREEQDNKNENYKEESSALIGKREKIVEEIATLDLRKVEILDKQQYVQQKHNDEREEFFIAERDLFKVLARKNELEGVLSKIHDTEFSVARREERYKKDIGEAGMIFGREVLNYTEYSLDFNEEIQEERRRSIERLRMKLEEMGIGSVSEVEKEYKDVVERDEFLEKEIKDLSDSRDSLMDLIKDIENELNNRFIEGIENINLQFHNFFTLMFGGGEAKLNLVKPKKRKVADEEIGYTEEDEDEFVKDGIDIHVTLPRKKIHSLDMLSGGERALTSIALLFALSQINPPPFIILDETDAALDEANSKRYGDMIESLSKYSQLILITHNRETMSRAGLIYGVTMKGDGVSRLLSIAFDEAVLVAK
ncbi:hypothetical protein COW81_03530 [Candidatus Campbellbacteria bacterium CG22_combo_CG10-13_8_21_14_all_36_13]|uniref:RecF/RecN/SMC N-terminal domain-containing protein n=1 Tax=Candidatus Campbellbacteria bacterium CG22_combo_CG10-13_8_21_14_all_36_13 TaxID=1974529 RepID=A0A2H0DXD1_9BACT|nr:MAG: hypothetical protein COW81_03530 [Candidatus Campbellbacteria bacterium CG22_combo_CG10-13_8_21_14_all_36_13]